MNLLEKEQIVSNLEILQSWYLILSQNKMITRDMYTIKFNELQNQIILIGNL